MLPVRIARRPIGASRGPISDRIPRAFAVRSEYVRSFASLTGSHYSTPRGSIRVTRSSGYSEPTVGVSGLQRGHGLRGSSISAGPAHSFRSIYPVSRHKVHIISPFKFLDGSPVNKNMASFGRRVNFYFQFLCSFQKFRFGAPPSGAIALRFFRVRLARAVDIPFCHEILFSCQFGGTINAPGVDSCHHVGRFCRGMIIVRLESELRRPQDPPQVAERV